MYEISLLGIRFVAHDPNYIFLTMSFLGVRSKLMFIVREDQINAEKKYSKTVLFAILMNDCDIIVLTASTVG